MNKVKAEIYRTIEETLQSSKPSLRVLDTEILFENARYKEIQTKELRIENTGNSIAPIEILQQKYVNHSRGWLSVSPLVATLNPGEIFSFTITACFNERQARKANIKEEYRNIMLILGIVGGSNYSISVSCDFVGSCFGASLKDLAKITVPVLTLNKCLKFAAQESLETQEIPKELVRIVEFIRENGLRQQGLFEETGNPDVVNSIRYSLDSGEPFGSYTDSYSMCSVLLEFLEVLKEPILPIETICKVFKVLQTASFDTARSQLYVFIGPVSSASLQYITSFAKELIENSEFNGLTADRIVWYLAEPLTHAEELDKSDKQLETDPNLRVDLISLLIKS